MKRRLENYQKPPNKRQKSDHPNIQSDDDDDLLPMERPTLQRTTGIIEEPTSLFAVIRP